MTDGDYYCGRGQNFFEVDDVVSWLFLCQHPGHNQYEDEDMGGGGGIKMLMQ